LKILYFDCFSGISGDMLIGALLDMGADPIGMEMELKKLQIEEEYELQWKKVVKNGISCTKFDVILQKNIESNHHHHHQHLHHHHHHQHLHHHRSYKDIVKLIERAGFSDQVRDLSLKVFRKIGEAEGHIHGIPLEEVHFHEVGAVDSIIDIVGAAILIHQMDISIFKSSAIPVGSGRIHINHGLYPVPAPATLEILKGIQIEQSDKKAELTTPTGAAIVSVISQEFCPIPSMRILSIGYGAGSKSFKEQPNVLRVILGEIIN
jgi:uncharacterized protein (TIGR00299 family) protein